MAEDPQRAAPEQDPWLTVPEVSEELKVHPATIRAWIKDGRLQAVRVGREWRVRRSEVDRALSLTTSPASATPGLASTGQPEAPMPAPRDIAAHIMTVGSAPGDQS
jgi:excisionase family DNA binding protein